MSRAPKYTPAQGVLALAGAAFIVTIAVVAPRAQGAPGGGQAAPPPPPGAPTKPLVPAAASSVANKPEQFYGEFLTVSATVEQVLGKMAFSIDQDKTKSTGKEVLVIPIRMNGPVEPNSYVTVIGQCVKFEPEAMADKAKIFPIDLPPDVAAKYRGKPVILASSVINNAMIDLAKWLPPPMTPEEAAFDKTMKAVGPANAAIRKAIEGSSVETLKEQTSVLRKAFTDSEAFWKGRGKTDAMKWAADARLVVDGIDKAAVAGQWDEVKKQATTLGQACQTCHTAYRERGEDGTFYIKPGSR
jgi:cytochrome c556